MGVAALSLDLRAQVLEAFDAACAQDDGSAGAGQHTGRLGAQPTRGAGDEGHAAGEVNRIGHLRGLRKKSYQGKGSSGEDGNTSALKCTGTPVEQATSTALIGIIRETA